MEGIRNFGNKMKAENCIFLWVLLHRLAVRMLSHTLHRLTVGSREGCPFCYKGRKWPLAEYWSAAMPAFLHCSFSSLKYNHLTTLVVVQEKKAPVFPPCSEQTLSLYSVSSEWNCSRKNVLWPVRWQITLRAKCGISQSRYENKSLGYNLFENMKVVQNMRSRLAA